MSQDLMSHRSFWVKGEGAQSEVAISALKIEDGASAGAVASNVSYEHGEVLKRDGVPFAKVVRLIAKGAFGAVYETVDGGRHSAMKAISDERAAAERHKYEKELAREAAICFAIGYHQNVVSVRRVLPLLKRVVTNAKGLLIMLDLADTSLRDAMGKKGEGLHEGEGILYMGDAHAPRPAHKEVERRLLSIVRQLYEGLGHMHDRGVFHQDIKARCHRAFCGMLLVAVL